MGAHLREPLFENILLEILCLHNRVYKFTVCQSIQKIYLFAPTCTLKVLLDNF